MSYAILKVRGWCEKLNNYRKSRSNPVNIPTISGTIPMDVLQHQPKLIPDYSNPVPSTSKCAEPISSPNPINVVLPGQIPKNETPETTKPNDSQASISSSVTSNAVPNSEPLDVAKFKNRVPSTPTIIITSPNRSTSAWPLNQSSMQAVPQGKIFILLPLIFFLICLFLFNFKALSNEQMSLRINNQAYNPEVVSSGLFSRLFLAAAIVGGVLIIFVNFIHFEFFDNLYPFPHWFTYSILLPLPIYMTNSALRTFTETSMREMFSQN